MAAPLRLFLVVLLLAYCPLAAFGAPPLHSVGLYHDDRFQEPQQKFFPSDKIYVLIDFPKLQKQDYNLSVEWIRPDGVLARNDTHLLSTVEEGAAQQVFFWLQLHEKGPVSQMLSGREYSEHVFGEWKVKLYCNGELLSIAGFTVTDVLP